MLAFDTTAAHRKAIWNIDTSKAYFAVLQAFGFDSSGVGQATSFTDPASTAARARHRHRAHASRRQVIGASRKIFP